MKKLFLTLLTLPALLLASCSNDEPAFNMSDNSNVTFVAQLPGTFSRAFADGEKATNLSYAVYESGTDTPVLSSQDANAPQAVFSNLQARLSLNLVSGKTYDIIFWADQPNSPYTFNPATQSISIDYTNVSGNDDNRDAFFQVEKAMAVNGAMQKTITLRRPFAQINFGTNDLAQAQAVGANIEKTQLKVSNVYSTLNLFTGVASDATEVTYTFAALPQGETFPVAGYDYIAMNYVLTGSNVLSNVHDTEKELVDCEFAIQDRAGNTVNTLSLSNVPVQRNYRTNVFGALLTSQVDYMIEINPDMFQPDYTVEVTASTPEDLLNALISPVAQKINVVGNIDLSAISNGPISFDTPKTIEIADDATVTLAADSRIETSADLTIKGGTISNEGSSSRSRGLGAGYNKSLIFVTGGTLTIDGATLINDPAYHYHGDASQGRPYNSAAISYWYDANITITDSKIISGEYTLCGMGRGIASGVITLTDSYFESTSSSQNGTGNWSYAMRLFGSKATITNCEVKGIQGGVSPDGGIQCQINGGKYYTVNTPGKKDAFYPLYVTSGAICTINDGEFSSPIDRSGLAIEGTSAVVCGDNDNHYPDGAVIINGGKFSGKAYNHVTKTVYEPAAGKTWKAIEGDDTFKWTIE